MSKIIRAIGLLIFAASVAVAQSNQAPYAGQEKREIKALSKDEARGLAEGRGMALAKAAELNHYPGPMHVLELADKLKLTEKQIAEAQRSFDKMREKAIHLGKQLIEKEKQLDKLFATRTANQENINSLVSQIARLQGELRFVHLRAHLEIRQALSAEQVDKYDELRGYKSGAGADSHKDHGQRKH